MKEIRMVRVMRVGLEVEHPPEWDEELSKV